MSRLSDRDELLLRQVHPSFLAAGSPTSQAFMPTPKDDARLSVDRGSMTTAADAFQRHASRYVTAGVWAISVGEVGAVELHADGDPIEGNRAHAVVVFEGKSNRDAKIAARLLARLAKDRGALYREARE